MVHGSVPSSTMVPRPPKPMGTFPQENDGLSDAERQAYAVCRPLSCKHEACFSVRPAPEPFPSSLDAHSSHSHLYLERREAVVEGGRVGARQRERGRERDVQTNRLVDPLGPSMFVLRVCFTPTF